MAQALNWTDIITFYGRTKFSTAPNEHGLQAGHSMVLAQWQKDRSGKLVKEVVWPRPARVPTWCIRFTEEDRVIWRSGDQGNLRVKDFRFLLIDGPMTR